MRKLYLLIACAILSTCCFLAYHQITKDPNRLYATVEEGGEVEDEDENEKYDGPGARDSFEFERMKDPVLGYIPFERLDKAIAFTNAQQLASSALRPQFALDWIERGPIFDSLGPSNGNTRGGVNYTSGRILAFVVDTLNDPTGNTVIAGAVAGGMWKCTNFLSTIPNWAQVTPEFNNLSISSICQDPAHANIMYFSTGEATSNADAVYGNGIWKSTDKGVTWAILPATANFRRSFKIMCDAAGNVYLATRALTAPIEQPYGLLRSKDGGTTWTNITPSGLTSSFTCTDIEISSTGRLHASFGYGTAGGVVNYRYTTDPANVTTTTWSSGTGLRTSNLSVGRIELACVADTIYGVAVGANNNTDSCYKSIDGGATWTKQNALLMPSGLGNGQGWYDLTLSVNPANSAELISGGLDAYRSVDGGATWTRISFWVGNNVPYVHADHHNMFWWNTGGESRIVISCDGGMFLSRNNGVTWADKNRNLAIKQFYAGAIHPDSASPYLIAGAQDNGCHQLKYAGLGPSNEVTGGDGCFVHISQLHPNVQFGSYVYNQYRRSLNGGATWSSVNYSTSAGMFVNPFTFDDSTNILYGCFGTGTIIRWPNANATTTGTVSIPFPNMVGSPSAFKVSPNTLNRLYIGTNSGKLYRLDSAHNTTGAAADLKDITGTAFPPGFINCVNVGSTDDYLVAVFTNFGVNSVWYTSNGGTTWSPIDGNLPDMPVRWAIFHPQYNNKLIIATETGVFTTDAANGANTQWNVSPGFPTVRTDMLNIRKSDNTVVAATHGRGLFTAIIPTAIVPQIEFVTPTSTLAENTGVVSGCKGYTDYPVDISILNPPTGNATVTFSVQPGSTATAGVDYDFTTNGSFTAKSNQVVFTSGVADKKTITIRVFDDASTETPESFTLGFAVSGTTNATAGTQQTHTVTIVDNDKASKIYANTSYSIGTFNSQIIATSPFASNRLKHRVQSLFSAAELKAAGLYKATNLNSLTLKVITKNSSKPYTGFTISLANTSLGTLSAGFTTAPVFTQVYSGNYTTVQGNNTFTFTTPFAWDGTSNVVVNFCFDNAAAPLDDYADFVEGNTIPLGLTVRASTYSNYTTGATDGCSLPAAFVSDFRINATFGAFIGDSVATELNATQTRAFGNNEDVYYYSAAGKIMARIRNLSTQDYGCTNVLIDRAGTGASPFWNASTASYVMNKTFKVVPTTNSATGRYEVTFYYTKAEKEGWEAATGQSWNNIQLIKVPNSIAAVTVANPQPDGPGTVQVITPVRGTFGSDYTLTGTFENGFSDFGAGIPGRLNTTLILRGNLNFRSVILDWTSSAEFNSTVYELEKSYDGITWHKIVTMNSSGTKFTPTNYNYVDLENVQTNFYRVRLQHTDGFVQLSNTVFIQNENAPYKMFVVPNPFEGNTIRVRFSRIPSRPVRFILYDESGREIAHSTVPATNSPSYSFPAVSTISGRVYYLHAEADGNKYAVRVMKK